MGSHLAMREFARTGAFMNPRSRLRVTQHQKPEPLRLKQSITRKICSLYRLNTFYTSILRRFTARGLCRKRQTRLKHYRNRAEGMEREEEKPEAGRQAAMDRLRDRTDELELIISSLTIFALFSLPGWLLVKFAAVYTHLSTSLVIAANVGLSLMSGVCYTLAVCFVIHLMTRAYWVGLIGLRSAFPRGIDWKRTHGLGPLGRDHFRTSLPDLDTAIEKADRLASSLFAIISMLTLGVLWFGVILIVMLVISGLIGARFGLTNTAMSIGIGLIIFMFLGISILNYLLDAQLAGRFPQLRESPVFRGTLDVLRFISGLAYPQRLTLPVQLTLQSNTRPLLYTLAFTASIFVIVGVGNLRTSAWQNFTLSNAFEYLETEDVTGGFIGTYYEDMSSPRDSLRAWPRVNSFQQNGSFAPLFLPYQPLRDNLVLDLICAQPQQPEDPAHCLRQLWSVTVEGEPIPMKTFITAERGELGMRGLMGLVPLAGLEPGLRRITVVWNPLGSNEDAPLDDRYSTNTRTYDIPIAFAPSVEMPLH